MFNGTPYFVMNGLVTIELVNGILVNIKIFENIKNIIFLCVLR